MYCQKCGNQLPEGANFCHSCGLNIGTGISTNIKLPASNLVRLGNYLLDRFLGGMVCLIFIIMVWGLISVLAKSGVIAEEGLIKKVLNLIVPVFIFTSFYVNPLYYLFFEGIWGRSIGKWITGTKVVRRDGTRPSFWQILGRSFARLIPFEAFSFLVGNNPIGWHDQLTKTLVVPVEYTPEDVKNINFAEAKKYKEGSTILIIVAVVLGILLVIPMIGIFSSIVLASLSSARNKAMDATMKENLSGLNIKAPLYFYSNSSYAEFCNSPETLKIFSSAQKNNLETGPEYVCNDDSASWAASIKLKSSKTYWCLDSTGENKEIETKLGENVTLCPAENLD